MLRYWFDNIVNFIYLLYLLINIIYKIISKKKTNTYRLCRHNSRQMKTFAILFINLFSFGSANMQTLNMDGLQQVSGGFDLRKTIVSDAGGFAGTGAGALAGTFTGMALGAIAGPGGMAAGGYIGGAVGGYLGGKLGSFVGEKSFGY